MVKKNQGHQVMGINKPLWLNLIGHSGEKSWVIQKTQLNA
jgi:hypothetical protein